MALKANITHSFKVAFPTVILSPLVIQIISILTNDTEIEFSIGMLYPQVIGLFVSIPYIILFIILVSFINKKHLSNEQKKLLIASINGVGILCLFGIIWQDLFWQDLLIFIPYILISTICIIGFKLPY